jgi:hypothetical protein
MTCGVRSWGHAGDALEAAVEVTVVGETELHGDVGDRSASLQVFARFFNALLKKPFVGRHAHEPAEGSNQALDKPVRLASS